MIPALIQKVLMTTTAVTGVVTFLLTTYERAVDVYRFEHTVTDSESDADDADRRANVTRDPVVPKRVDGTDSY